MQCLKWGALALVGVWGTLAQADGHMSDDQQQALVCLELVGTSTQWGQCVSMIFEPCADEDVNTEAHAECLLEQRGIWEATFRSEMDSVTAKLTDVGAEELKTIMDGWGTYMTQQCQASSLERGGSKSALHGCEVAEVVSATAELFACRKGVSTAPFCQLKPE